MRQTDRHRTDVRRASSLNAPYARGSGIINDKSIVCQSFYLDVLGRTSYAEVCGGNSA